MYTVRLTAKFHHPMFSRSEVIVLTDKQTDAAENIHLAPLYAMSVGKILIKCACVLTSYDTTEHASNAPLIFAATERR